MEPIKRVPIVQQVEEKIRQLIESGQYGPGEKLPAEMDLCQRLGVGRGTIREAFRLLQARGYVEIKPGRGALVAERLPAAGSGNHLPIAIHQQINQGMKTFRSKTFQVPQNVRNAVAPHTRIMEAIQARNGDMAENAMRAHLDKVQEDLRDNVANPG